MGNTARLAHHGIRRRNGGINPVQAFFQTTIVMKKSPTMGFDQTPITIDHIGTPADTQHTTSGQLSLPLHRATAMTTRMGRGTVCIAHSQQGLQRGLGRLELLRLGHHRTFQTGDTFRIALVTRFQACNLLCQGAHLLTQRCGPSCLTASLCQLSLTV